MDDTQTFQYECQSCGRQFNEDDAGGPGYECSRCGESFTQESSYDGDSNRCPNCMIYGGKAAELSCPDCADFESIEEGEFSPPPPTEEELAAARERDAENQKWMEKRREERRIERDRDFEERRQRWSEDGDDLAGRFAAVNPELPHNLRSVLLDVFGIPTYNLRTTDALGIACLLAGQPVPEGYERMDTDERVAAWGPVKHVFADLGLYQTDWDQACSAMGLKESVMVQIAEKLA